MNEPIVFLASFPAIQSAIKITGDNTGMRIQLDIPESEMAQAIHVIPLTRKVLKVTIEPVNYDEKAGTINRRSAKQRNE